MAIDVWEEMLTFHRRTLAAMDQHLTAECGRGLDDYDVLYQLHEAGEPLRMGDLAERLLVANSSCHRIVSRLARDGLLQVIPDENDRRSRLVSLSDQGIRQHRLLAVVHRRDISRFFTDRLTPDDLSQLAKVFDDLNTNQGQ